MRKSIRIVLFIVITTALVHDVSRYAKTSYDIDNVAALTTDMLISRGEDTRNQNATLAAEYAAQRGAIVYMYDQDESTFHAWLQAPVEGTWILGTVMNYYTGGSNTDKYQVKSEAEGRFR